MTTRPIYATVTPAAGLMRSFRLRESLEAVEGEVDFRVLVAEHPRVAHTIRARYPGQVWLAIDEVGCADWLHLGFYYEAWELACALQPSLMRTLLRDGDVIYIDADSEVLSPLSDTHAALAAGRGRLLALDGPVARGPVDLGFFAVPSRSGFASLLEDFAAYLAEPERHVSGPLAGAGLSAATALWSARLLLRGDIDVAPADGWIRRYAGLAGVWGARFGRYQDFHNVDPDSDLRNWVDEYHVALDGSAYRELGDWPYSLSAFADGTPVTSEQRRAFLRLARPNRRRIVDPFADSHVMAHLWSRSPGLAMERADRELRERYARLADTARGTGHALLERVARALPSGAYAQLGRIVRRLRG